MYVYQNRFFYSLDGAEFSSQPVSEGGLTLYSFLPMDIVAGNITQQNVEEFQNGNRELTMIFCGNVTAEQLLDRNPEMDDVEVLERKLVVIIDEDGNFVSWTETLSFTAEMSRQNPFSIWQREQSVSTTTTLVQVGGVEIDIPDSITRR